MKDGTLFFFFNDTATTEIYTLSLHDSLPISRSAAGGLPRVREPRRAQQLARPAPERSEEHTSELQSRSDLVCRLLLEKKKYTALGQSTDGRGWLQISDMPFGFNS